MTQKQECVREYDFALILSGVHELTTEVEDALFKAGCDDATLSIQYGNIYMEFSRTSPTLIQAILSAIQNVQQADIGAQVCRVNECDLVTQSEIARRIDRTRQSVHQYIKGTRGPGGFPAPVCYMPDGVPFWTWCSVSYWLWQNDMIRPDELERAQTIAAINNALENLYQRVRTPEIVEAVNDSFASCR